MRHKRRFILAIASVTSVAVSCLVLLQWAGIVPPLGVGWGDGRLSRAYSVEIHGPITFRTASGMTPPPPGNYAYGVQSLAQSDAAGISYHRWNMTAGNTPGAPVLGSFAEVRVAPIWPLQISLTLVLLWITLVIRQRRADRDAGRCLHCGYDLRATPERCPECGSVPAARPARA
jgi:hypothetical protein